MITGINGTVVKTGNDLVNPIASAPIGSKVTIDYYRDKQKKETSAIVEDRTRVFPNTDSRVGEKAWLNRLLPNSASMWKALPQSAHKRLVSKA